MYANLSEFVTFVTSVWGGRVSDVHLVRESGFLDPNMHQPGDQILADRGFTMKDELAAVCGVELIVPSFTKGHKQLPTKDVELSRRNSAVRIHVERVIGCVKKRFRILKGTLPIKTVHSAKDEACESSFSNIDKIIIVGCFLFNIGPSIVTEKQTE